MNIHPPNYRSSYDPAHHAGTVFLPKKPVTESRFSIVSVMDEQLNTNIAIDYSGAVYTSPVCRDETLAGLKIKKRNLAENMLTRQFWYKRQIHALFNKFSIKNIIRNLDVANNIFCRKILIFASFFVLNKVSMLAQLAELMHLHGQI